MRGVSSCDLTIIHEHLILTLNDLSLSCLAGWILARQAMLKAKINNPERP